MFDALISILVCPPGATAFLSTWQAIGEEDEENAGEGGKTNHRSKPQPFVFLAGLDFSRTRWGLIFGGPVILGSLAVSVEKVQTVRCTRFR